MKGISTERTSLSSTTGALLRTGGGASTLLGAGGGVAGRRITLSFCPEVSFCPDVIDGGGAVSGLKYPPTPSPGMSGNGNPK